VESLSDVNGNSRGKLPRLAKLAGHASRWMDARSPDTSVKRMTTATSVKSQQYATRTWLDERRAPTPLPFADAGRRP
jgi:hypothetical protein